MSETKGIYQGVHVEIVQTHVCMLGDKHADYRLIVEVDRIDGSVQLQYTDFCPVILEISSVFDISVMDVNRPEDNDIIRSLMFAFWVSEFMSVATARRSDALTLHPLQISNTIVKIFGSQCTDIHDRFEETSQGMGARMTKEEIALECTKLFSFFKNCR